MSRTKKRGALTLVFDTETTDLSQNSVRRMSEQPFIYEFCGFVLDHNGKQIGELDFQCKPGGPISEDSTRVTGVHNEDVADLAPFADYRERVRAIIEDADEVVAHHLAFDHFVVNCEFKRAEASIRWPDKRICTVEQTEHFFGYRLSLTALHEHLFGVAFEQAHKARTDVEALTRCFLELRKRGVV